MNKSHDVAQMKTNNKLESAACYWPNCYFTPKSGHTKRCSSLMHVCQIKIIPSIKRENLVVCVRSNVFLGKGKLEVAETRLADILARLT